MARCRTLLLLMLCLAGTRGHAQACGDLQAQILYVFRAEDTNQLAGLVQTLSTQQQTGDDATLRYHLAHAWYRLGLLGAESGPPTQRAFARCIEELKPLLELRPARLQGRTTTARIPPHEAVSRDPECRHVAVAPRNSRRG